MPHNNHADDLILFWEESKVSRAGDDTIKRTIYRKAFWPGTPRISYSLRILCRLAPSLSYSGLVAFQRKTSVTANNVANVNTDGFKKSRTALSTVQPHGVNAEVEKIDTPVPITVEHTTQGDQRVEKSNVDVGEEMVGSLLDIVDDENNKGTHFRVPSFDHT